MRFMVIYKGVQHEPSPEKAAAIGKFAEEMFKAGVLLDTGGILPIQQGAKTEQRGGKFKVTDGPFIETKEMIVGYAIISVKSKEEAIETSRRFMAIAGDGESELRQMVGHDEGPPPTA